MAVRKVSYVYLKVPNRAGQAANVLGALQAGKVNLSAITAFPDKGGKTQVDLITRDLAGVRRVAKKQGWRVSKAKKGFLIQGKDRLGAVSRHARNSMSGCATTIAYWSPPWWNSRAGNCSLCS